MSVYGAENSTTGREEQLAPDYIAHWVVKTARSKEMIAWYHTVFGARIVHENPRIAFLTWDEESHRMALVKMPHLLRYLFPLARLRRKVYGVDHLGFTIRSLEQLLSTYERLKKAGVTPVWAVNHGPTTSLYYEDPDGIRLEFQTENFSTAKRPLSTFTAARSPRIPSGSILTPTIYLSDSAMAQTLPNYSSKVLEPALAPRHDAPSPGRRSDQKPSTVKRYRALDRFPRLPMT
jgi:catechol 2,3-dioxygenase-like lactoylglutathione lyase family enzyme